MVDALFFTSSLGGGGAEKHLARLLVAFDRRQLRPRLALARRGGSYLGTVPEDVPVTAWFDAGRSSTLSCLASAPLLARLIATRAPDVVMSVMEIPNLTLLAAARLVRRRPRIVLCVQVAPRPAYRDGLLGGAVLAGIRRGYHLADRIIALSAGVRDELAELDPRLRAKTVVIPNAIVDDEVRRARPVPRGAGGPVVVGCGRLVPQKNFPLLLRAFAEVRRGFPGARLWILGDGPDRGALEALAGELGVAPAVTFQGFVDDPWAFFAAADLFVLSAAFEGFGNVLVEAMACGLPVISTRCPHGPAEIIDDGTSGLLVPVDDPAALAEAMTRVLRNDTLRARLREGGARRARDFDATAIAARYAVALGALPHPGMTDANIPGR